MSIRDEIARATAPEVHAYLTGASRDATFNRLHRTTRFSQANRAWLETIQVLLRTVGSASWIYREGARNIWVVESSWRAMPPKHPWTALSGAAFARGYFDAEGGLPRDPDARFYIQLVQKDLADLTLLKQVLDGLCISTGKIHNPSVRQDPDYWRFYIRSRSHERFIRAVSSWHPRKRVLLDERLRRIEAASKIAGNGAGHRCSGAKTDLSRAAC